MATVSSDSELREVGDGTYAYLQTRRGWGWSNAGLVTSGDASLLVDTLFDVPLTADMLATMRRTTPAATSIDTVVNTHANGDHCWGNQLVAGAEIVASRACAEEMLELPPKMVASLVAVAKLTSRLGAAGKRLTNLLGRIGVRKLGAIGDAAELVVDAFDVFEFRGIELTPPTSTFDGEMTLVVGDKRVELTEVGPAHTRGDILVHVPDDRVVFTGDILFVGCHPIMWVGPVASWIRALERVLAMDVDTVVPGHGPVTNRAGVQVVLDYFVHLRDQARARFDAGMTAADAALDIDLAPFSGWGEPERVAANVWTLFREFSREQATPDAVQVFGAMGRFATAAGLR